MFVQWILDHMGEYGMASLTCTSYEAGRDTLFDDGTQARRWHVGNDGRTGAYTTEDLTAVPLDGDGSFDGPEVETLLEPGTLVLTMCFVKFLWAVSAFLLVRLSGCF